MPDDRNILGGGVLPEEGASGKTTPEVATIIEGTGGVAVGATIIEGAQARAETSLNLVPSGIFLEYTLQKPLQVTSGEADLWFIADPEGKEYVLKLYRYGIKPKEEIAAKIKALGYEHVVTIEKSGEISGRYYEVLEKIEHGDLDDYAGGKPLAEEKLKVVVEELGSAVAHMHESGIIHRDIKPANILVRTLEPLDLVMTDFGISSMSDVSLHMTSVNRTALYSAPEAINGIVAKGSDWWCVGVILLKLLRGKHPLEGLNEQAITFQLVTKGVKVPEEISSDWQLLLKGLLTRDPDKRWKWGQVEQWLAGKRDIATKYEGDQKEEKQYDYRPYKLRGKEIYEPEEVAVYLGENWSEGVKQFGRGFVTDWVKNNYQDLGLASDLTDIAEDEGLDGDGKLSAVLMVTARELPLFWKGDVVSRDWLVGNPEAALQISNSRLLHYYGLHRSEDELKLEEIAGRVKEVREVKSLQGPVRDLIISLAIDPEHPLKLGENIIDSQEWMAANSREAVKILEGGIPDWQERLTGKTSLKDARDGWKAWWQAIKAHGIGVDKDQVDALILQSVEERNTRFNDFWKKFENGDYVGAKDKGVQALLDKGETGPVEQIILLGCNQELFLNAQEKHHLDSMEHLRRFGVPMDWDLAGKLIKANSWESINPILQMALASPLAEALKGNERITSIYSSQQAEYLDVIALVSASMKAKGNSDRRIDAQSKSAGPSQDKGWTLIEEGKYWQKGWVFACLTENKKSYKMVMRFGPREGETVIVPGQNKWLYSGVDPREKVCIEYSNFEGIRQTYSAKLASMRKVNGHISFESTAGAGRFSLKYDRIKNQNSLPAIPAKQEYKKILSRLRHGTTNADYETLRKQFPAFAPPLPNKSEKRILTYHENRGSTSARYEELKAKFSPGQAEQITIPEPKEVSVLISRAGQQMGPYTISQATQMAQNGLILETDFYWAEGMTDWKPALELLETTGAKPRPNNRSKITELVDPSLKKEALAHGKMNPALKEIIVAQLGWVDPAQVTLDARFIEDLKADPADFWEIVMAYERKFDIAIFGHVPSLEEAQEECTTVADLIRYINRAT